MAQIFFFLAAIFILGVIALPIVLTRSIHWRTVSQNALINVSLAFGFALLLSPVFGFFLLALYPAVLAAAIASASAARSSYLLHINDPPEYVRIYPTSRLSLLLVACVAIVGIYRAWAWRESAEAEVGKQIDPALVISTAEGSAKSREYMKTYFKRHNRTTIADKDIIQVCGAVLRLSESDGAPVLLPFSAAKICRLSPSYTKS